MPWVQRILSSDIACLFSHAIADGSLSPLLQGKFSTNWNWCMQGMKAQCGQQLAGIERLKGRVQRKEEETASLR